MDITDEKQRRERRTSFKKITQEEDEKDPSTEAGEGRWEAYKVAARRRRYGVATNLTDGASQFPPGTRGEKRQREREKCPVIIKHFIFLYFCDFQQ